MPRSTSPSRASGVRRLALLVGAALVGSTPAAAQEEEPEAGLVEQLRSLELLSSLSVGIFAGGASYGSFLEERMASGREREITSAKDPSMGGSIGLSPWERTGLRLGFAWSPLDLSFEDDTGDGGTELNAVDVLDINAWIITGELIRYVWNEDGTFVPYAMGGVSLTLWTVDEAELGGVVQGNKGTYPRLGGTASVGLEYRASDRFRLRAELTTAELGNPFEGKEALRSTEGVTFREPSRVNRTGLNLGLIYAFSGGG